MRKRATVTLLIALFVPVFAVGCRQILGLDDPAFNGEGSDAAPQEGATSDADGGGMGVNDADADAGDGDTDAGDADADAGDADADADADSGDGGGALGVSPLAAFDHACAVYKDGRIACWGSNVGGAAIGSGNDGGAVYAPEYVIGITNGVQVSMWQGSTCAVLADGTVRCWGENPNGLCSATGGTCYVPQTILMPDGGPLLGATKVGVGAAYTAGAGACARRSGGDAVCWGGCNAECSRGSTTGGPTPAQMLSGPSTPFTNVVDITAGQDSLDCLLLGNGTVHCAGNQSWVGDGYMGSGVPLYFADTVLTAPATNLTGVGQVSCSGAGGVGCCAVQSADRSVMNCWSSGGNNYATTTVPGIVGPIKELSVVTDHACVVLDDGTAQCWGFNQFGELGDQMEAGTASTVAVTVKGLPKKVAHIAAGANFTCASLVDDTIWCWGKGDQGQLGNGLGAASLVPVKVSDPVTH